MHNRAFCPVTEPQWQLSGAKGGAHDSTIVPRVLQVIPEARPDLHVDIASWDEPKSTGIFSDLSFLAQRVVRHAATDNIAPAEAVFGVLNDWPSASDDDARAHLVWGLLEDIHTIATHTPALTPLLESRLGAVVRQDSMQVQAA